MTNKNIGNVNTFIIPVNFVSPRNNLNWNIIRILKEQIFFDICRQQMHNNQTYQLYCINEILQHMTTITNLSDVIPTMESIPCPDCGNRVTISPHPNSHFIAGMDDCLYHGQCKNIACQTCSKKKKVFLVCIACLATNKNRSVHGSTHGVHTSTKTAT